jgi:ABC-type polysaccharide/polyol phosphate export permease
MEKQQRFRAFIIPMLVIMLTVVNYSRLKGTENIQAIHIVSLIAIGIGIGLLLASVTTYFRKNR